MSKSLTKLSVNINAAAYLRNRRDVPWPSLLNIARGILDAGAHGITVHPRPDQRHIRFTDVADISHLISSEFPEAEFNIEGYPTPQFIELALSVKAHQVTLVPDDPGQSTSDHGWNFAKNEAMLTDVAKLLKKEMLRVSMFVDANVHDPLSAWSVGADRIEFYTGPYGGQTDQELAKIELNKLGEAANAARKTGYNRRDPHPALAINAGHDLNLHNLPALLTAIPDLAEVSIGHAITSDALMLGYPTAVRRYLKALGHTVSSA